MGSRLVTLVPANPGSRQRRSPAREARGQLRPQDAIFGGQVFVLKKQFLIDQTGYVGQQADPAILFHAEGP